MELHTLTLTARSYALLMYHVNDVRWTQSGQGGCLSLVVHICIWALPYDVRLVSVNVGWPGNETRDCRSVKSTHALL